MYIYIYIYIYARIRVRGRLLVRPRLWMAEGGAVDGGRGWSDKQDTHADDCEFKFWKSKSKSQATTPGIRNSYIIS